MAKLVKSYSNYILKRNHQSLTDGTVYERDITTIGGVNRYTKGQIPIYAESNFKMTINNDTSQKRKHKYGDWERTPDGSDKWDLEDVLNQSGTSGVTSDSKIILKNDYNNLLDFAYYGSCVELVRASIEDIILKFPAELYLSDNIPNYYTSSKFIINSDGKSATDGKTTINIDYIVDNEGNKTTDKDVWYIAVSGLNEYEVIGNSYFVAETLIENVGFLVENPFNIDLYTKINNKNDITNVLRYFSLSYSDYEIIFQDSSNKPVTSWKFDAATGDNACPVGCYTDGCLIGKISIGYEGGVILLSLYYVDGNKILTYDNETDAGVHIRPIKKHIDEYFNNLDSFQKVLLNTRTKPTYKATFDLIKETDEGFVTSRELFIFPVLNGWNLDIESMQYNDYLTRLMSSAQIYDEYFSDNLYRSLTHEAIKNFDWTYTREYNEGEEEEYVIGGTKIENIIRVYGREFDELKRYIDNIKFVNVISYDNKNNLPNFFLNDSLNLAGWEVSPVIPYSANTFTPDLTVETDILFDGETSGYTATDVQNQFLKRLRLNAKRILKSKGTKRSLERLLSLFGINRDLYEINENVVVIDKPLTDDGLQGGIASINSMKLSYGNDNGLNTSPSEYEGLPLIVEKTDTNTVDLYPWFDKSQTYDGDMYFQGKGGWGHMKEKYESDGTIIKESGDSRFIYSETLKYINVVTNIESLITTYRSQLNENDVYFVEDITNIKDYIPSAIVNERSHYFILTNIDNSDFIYDEVDDDTKGWENVKYVIKDGKAYIDNPRILYLESIIDNTIGNNPHVGYGEYDDGETYLDYFRQIFKGAIDTDDFSSNAEIRYAYPLSGDGITINNKFIKLDDLIDYEKVKVINYNNNWYPLYEYAKEDNLYYNIIDGKYSTDMVTYKTVTNKVEAVVINNNFYESSNGRVLVNGTSYQVKDNMILLSFIDNISNIGFDLNMLTDNKKCWYFGETLDEDGNKMEHKIGDYQTTISNYTHTPSNIYKDWTKDTRITNLNGSGMTNDMNPKKIINVKTFSIDFNLSTLTSEYILEYKKYILKIVKPYLEQLIPSSSIWEINFK